MAQWIKCENKSYVNLDNGALLLAQSVQIVPGTTAHRVLGRQNNGTTQVLAMGYGDLAEAQAALDEYMDTITFTQVPPPVTSAEV